MLFHSLESYTAIPYTERYPRPANPIEARMPQRKLYIQMNAFHDDGVETDKDASSDGDNDNDEDDEE